MLRSPAFPIRAVDTTGAGDAFDAVFVFGIVERWEIEKAARLANAAGALCARRIGARTGLPTMQELMDFLRRFGDIPQMTSPSLQPLSERSKVDGVE